MAQTTLRSRAAPRAAKAPSARPKARTSAAAKAAPVRKTVSKRASAVVAKRKPPAKRKALAKRKPPAKRKALAKPKMPAAARRSKAAPRASKRALDPLALYNQKRDFSRTSEPSGASLHKGSATELRYVVQKHAASHLHYDFRLELNGVLLSWSVPKGPSLRAGERRLAVRTEDHPLDYADFEGTIPKGEYGGGSVLVWDRGSWQTEGDPDKDFKKGRLTFTLQGEKLTGRFHLVRSKLGADKRENWLLFKGRDDSAQDTLDIVSERPESVLSGKTIEEIGESVEPGKRSERSKRKPPAGQVERMVDARPRARERIMEAEPVADMVEMVSRLSPGFALTSLDRVLYPEQGLRKAEIIAYYVSVASVMLPYVGHRPLVLVRCPQGQTQACFYQKHIDKGVPDAVLRVRIVEGRGSAHEQKKTSSKSVQYAAVQDANGLIALAQMGVLEIHTWGCHADKVEKPDLFVFDIDPDESLPFERVIETAFELKESLSQAGLTSFVKTTGGKGLHVVAPVERGLSWEQHKAFSHGLVEKLARARPDRYLTNMRKELRKGKLFLDYLRNGRGATAIAPYSTRARSGALVATPLRWDELTRGLKPQDFDVRSVLRRLEAQKQDPWKGFHELKQSVPTDVLKKASS